MSQKISEFPLLKTLAGEIWLECIQRLHDDERFEHYRVGPDELAKLFTSVSLNLGLITTAKLALDAKGMAKLPSKPLGGLLFNMAQIFCIDGSVVEVIGCTVETSSLGYHVKLPPADFEELKTQIASIVVCYVGELS